MNDLEYYQTVLQELEREESGSLQSNQQGSGRTLKRGYQQEQDKYTGLELQVPRN